MQPTILPSHPVVLTSFTRMSLYSRVMRLVQRYVQNDVEATFYTSLSMRAACINNWILSEFYIYPGNPTLGDTWRQYHSFVCSSMTFCAVIGRFSSIHFVAFSSAYTFSSLKLSLLFSKSSFCMDITIPLPLLGVVGAADLQHGEVVHDMHPDLPACSQA